MSGYYGHCSQIGRLHELRKYGLQSIGMTTNGIALHRKLPALVENGLTHLNIRFAPHAFASRPEDLQCPVAWILLTPSSLRL